MGADAGPVRASFCLHGPDSSCRRSKRRRWCWLASPISSDGQPGPLHCLLSVQNPKTFLLFESLLLLRFLLICPFGVSDARRAAFLSRFLKFKTVLSSPTCRGGQFKRLKTWGTVQCVVAVLESGFCRRLTLTPHLPLRVRLAGGDTKGVRGGATGDPDPDPDPARKPRALPTALFLSCWGWGGVQWLAFLLNLPLNQQVLTALTQREVKGFQQLCLPPTPLSVGCLSVISSLEGAGSQVTGNASRAGISSQLPLALGRSLFFAMGALCMSSAEQHPGLFH